MTFVKHTCGGGAAITPAGLVLSGLDEHELLELHTLNGAIVIFGAGTERLERAAIAYELVRMAEAIMTDVLAEQEEEPEEETIPLPCEALSRAGLDGDEIHVICDEGIVMIVGIKKKLGRMMFKHSVETNITNHILAADTDMDQQTYEHLRNRSVREVLETNGEITFLDDLKFQKSV